jgi:galactitol-specific phosphotransferase system IIB component
MADEPAQQDAGQGVAEQKPESQKTFSQEDVNNLIAKESKNAVEKILKDLGVQDAKSAKTEAAKTEAEAKANAAEAKFAAIAAGVPVDKADKVVKLAMAYDGETIQDKISAVLAEIPELKGQPQAQAPSLGGKTNNQATSDIDKMLAEARKAAGLA